MTETPAASTGWVLAPDEPDAAMKTACAAKLIELVYVRSTKPAWPETCAEIYRAMLAAAPARVLSEEDVEKAARAYYYARPIFNPIPGKDHHQPWETLLEDHRYSIRTAMRAALAVLSVDETIEGE